MNTLLLEELYEKYNIANLSYGVVHDKLGDVYEEYCISIFTNKEFLAVLQKSGKIESVEFDIFQTLLTKANVEDISNIREISATNVVPHRKSHGNAKTDVIATITYSDGKEVKLPISSKQSYVRKVAVAEFDVDTICDEADIDTKRLRQILKRYTERHH